MAPVIDLDRVERDKKPFHTEHTVWSMGATVLTRAVLPAGQPRQFKHIRKEPLDHWCLVLWQPPVPQEQADGRLTNRLLGIRSLGRAFETVVADTSVLTLYIPRDLVPSAAGLLDAAEGEFAQTGLAALLSDYLTALERRLPFLGIDETARIAEATTNIIAACLAPSAERLEAARPAANWTLVERARRAIQLNLGAPDFSPDELCRMIGTSRSKLYRVFEPFGGVARYVQRQRLREARKLLGRADGPSAVSRISREVGFTDLSSFSRAFRREFGMSPSEVRCTPALTVPTLGQQAFGPAGPSSDTTILSEALRHLQG